MRCCAARTSRDAIGTTSIGTSSRRYRPTCRICRLPSINSDHGGRRIRSSALDGSSTDSTRRFPPSTGKLPQRMSNASWERLSARALRSGAPGFSAPEPRSCSPPEPAMGALTTRTSAWAGVWVAVHRFKYGPESLRTNADDRLSLDPFGRVEGGDGIVEGSHVADVCPHSSVSRPPDNLTQLGAIGYDDEVNRPAVGGPRLGRAGDSHQRSSGSNHARRPLRDVAAEDIEHQIDSADIFQSVVIEVYELLRADVERRLTAGSAPGADDVRAGLTCELGCHRTDYAGRTVHKDALPRTKAAVLEQPLPRGQARHHEGRARCEVNVPRQRREVACLDGYILRQRAVASPVREAEHPLSHRQPRRSIAEGGDPSGQLVAGERWRPVTA